MKPSEVPIQNPRTSIDSTFELTRGHDFLVRQLIDNSSTNTIRISVANHRVDDLIIDRLVSNLAILFKGEVHASVRAHEQEIRTILKYFPVIHSMSEGQDGSNDTDIFGCSCCNRIRLDTPLRDVRSDVTKC